VSAIPIKRRSADRSLSPYSTRARTILWATFGLLGLILAGYLAAMILWWSRSTTSGRGVSSLAYLSSLAVKELKLDRTFITGLVGGDSDRELDLVRSTIELGHAMGLRIVAEGIEDNATLELLSDLGCDFAQGYCISRPKPASELAFRSHLDAGPASGAVNGSRHPLVGVGPDTTATP
jgi:hypothetical protein